MPALTRHRLSQVAADLGDSAGANTRWIERRERPGQAPAINYPGRVGWGGGWPGEKETCESQRRKKYGAAAPARAAGGRGAGSVRVCQSDC